MRILVDGPRWAGKLSEITVAALRALSHDVDFFCHNRKTLKERILKRLNRWFPATAARLSWEKGVQRRLARKLAGRSYDLLLSIQGKLGSTLCHALKRAHPQLRMLYWTIDPLVPRLRDRLRKLLDASRKGALDLILTPFRATVKFVHNLGGERARYFPFGYSPEFRAVPTHVAVRPGSLGVRHELCSPRRSKMRPSLSGWPSRAFRE